MISIGSTKDVAAAALSSMRHGLIAKGLMKLRADGEVHRHKVTKLQYDKQ